MANEDWPTKERVLADAEFQTLHHELGLEVEETSDDETPLSFHCSRNINQDEHQRMMGLLRRLCPTDLFHTVPAYPVDPSMPLYDKRMANLASRETTSPRRIESVAEKPDSSSRSIFAADAWVFYAPDHPNDRVKRFASRGRPPIKQLINNTLLYDEIVIPTQDFLGYGILVDVLGERAVLDLLEADRLRFLRVKGSIAYGPAGRGLMTYVMMNSEKRPVRGMGEVEEAITWALGGSNAPRRDPLLASLALQKTQEIELPVGEIRHETYMDVLNSPYLREAFSLRSRDMDNLAGIDRTQMRVYSGPEASHRGDEIDTLLSIAAANLELRLAQVAGCSDASTLSPVGHLLKAKADRSFDGLDAAEAFTVLREIADVPDVGEAVLNKHTTVGDVIKISKTRNGEQFRKWFHENCRDNPIATGKEYAALLRDVPRIQSIPVKVLRFILTSGIGAIPGIGPLLGLAGGAVDNFFIEKWLRGNSPKYLIEDLSQIQAESEPNEPSKS